MTVEQPDQIAENVRVEPPRCPQCGEEMTAHEFDYNDVDCPGCFSDESGSLQPPRLSPKQRPWYVWLNNRTPDGVEIVHNEMVVIFYGTNVTAELFRDRCTGTSLSLVITQVGEYEIADSEKQCLADVLAQEFIDAGSAIEPTQIWDAFTALDLPPPKVLGDEGKLSDYYEDLLEYASHRVEGRLITSDLLADSILDETDPGTVALMAFGAARNERVIGISALAADRHPLDVARSMMHQLLIRYIELEQIWPAETEAERDKHDATFALRRGGPARVYEFAHRLAERRPLMTDRQLGDYLAALFNEDQRSTFFDENETPECWLLADDFRDEVAPFIHSRAALQARIENHS